MRERLNASRAQSEILKLRLGGLSETFPEISHERLNHFLSTAYKHRPAETVAHTGDPIVPAGIPMAKLRDKAPTV